MDAFRFPLCIGAIAAALLLPGVALAQTSATIAQPKPKPKPAPAAKHAATTAQGKANSDYWSVNYGAPSRYDTPRTITRNSNTELTGELGRVPLQSGGGTIGFDTQSKVNPNVPGGVDPYARKESSFVGMSINVQSLDKNMPLPILPTPWSRPE